MTLKTSQWGPASSAVGRDLVLFWKIPLQSKPCANPDLASAVALQRRHSTCSSHEEPPSWCSQLLRTWGSEENTPFSSCILMYLAQWGLSCWISLCQKQPSPTDNAVWGILPAGEIPFPSRALGCTAETGGGWGEMGAIPPRLCTWAAAPAASRGVFEPSLFLEHNIFQSFFPKGSFCWVWGAHLCSWAV